MYISQGFFLKSQYVLVRVYSIKTYNDIKYNSNYDEKINVHDTEHVTCDN